jgi:hypothetical protein
MEVAWHPFGKSLPDLAPSLSLTPTSPNRPPIGAAAFSSTTPRPHTPVARARPLPALSSLSHAPRHRGTLDWKEEDEPDPAASPASTPTRLLCIPKPSLRHSQPKHRPVTSLCSVRCAPRAPRARICVPSRVAPEPLFPSRMRARHRTRTLSLPRTWPLVHHTAHGSYRTPSATKPSPPFPEAPACDARPFRLC